MIDRLLPRLLSNAIGLGSLTGQKDAFVSDTGNFYATVVKLYDNSLSCAVEDKVCLGSKIPKYL